MRGGSKRVIGGLVIGALVLIGLSAVPASAAKSAAPAKCADPSGKVQLGLSYFGSLSGALESIGANETAELTPADKAIIDGYQAGIDALNKVPPIVRGLDRPGSAEGGTRARAGHDDGSQSLARQTHCRVVDGNPPRR